MLIATVVLPSVARAAEIEVVYRVDAKALKKSTPAGTSVSFQLFTDSTCTTSVGASQSANIEALSLIEQPKLIRVRGGPRPPSIAEIRFTMTGVAIAPSLYATATGTGITPIGGACQVQVASTRPGVPVWKDANGVFVGQYGGVSDEANARLAILVPFGASTVAVTIHNDEIGDNGPITNSLVFFASNDCTGTAGFVRQYKFKCISDGHFV